EKNVIVTEELLNSRVDAGKLIYCNGKRAQISGGILRAGEEVNARAIGADSYIRTEIFVGLNPKVLQQLNDLESVLKETAEELEKLSKDITTLNNRRRTTALTEEQKEMLSSYMSRSEKLEERKQEVFSEMEELREYMKMIEQKGLVSAEKNLYPGVEIFVKDQKLKINDEYSDVRITFENGDWRFGKYELPLGQQPKYARRSFGRRR
ncbi:MAG TPA: FapA family protein, partial [Spirochaetota bacterium]|nr:FapA family protein [Spirochaetota bacterium]